MLILHETNSNVIVADLTRDNPYMLESGDEELARVGKLAAARWERDWAKRSWTVPAIVVPSA